MPDRVFRGTARCFAGLLSLHRRSQPGDARKGPENAAFSEALRLLSQIMESTGTDWLSGQSGANLSLVREFPASWEDTGNCAAFGTARPLR